MHDSTKFKYKIRFEDVKSGDVIAAHNTDDGRLFIFEVDEADDYIDDVSGDITLYKDSDWEFYSESEPVIELPTEPGVYAFTEWPHDGLGPIIHLSNSRIDPRWTLIYSSGSTTETSVLDMKSHMKSWGLTKLAPQK